MTKGGKPDREERLKAALKANMARRKSQKRGRAPKSEQAAGEQDKAPAAPRPDRDEQEKTDNG